MTLFFELVRDERTDLVLDEESLSLPSSLLLLLLIFRLRQIGRGEFRFLRGEPEDSRGEEAGSESLSVTAALLENGRFVDNVDEAAAEAVAVAETVILFLETAGDVESEERDEGTASEDAVVALVALGGRATER